jgi:hypothetical protein
MTLNSNSKRDNKVTVTTMTADELIADYKRSLRILSEGEWLATTAAKSLENLTLLVNEMLNRKMTFEKI